MGRKRQDEHGEGEPVPHGANDICLDEPSATNPYK